MWFAAHTIRYFQYTDGDGGPMPLYENVLLVEADSPEAALAKADRFARAEEGDDAGSLRWGGRPATRVYAGVRKLIQCDPPGDGVEVTYSQLTVAGSAALARLPAGEPVEVQYEE